ncbi:MAG: hypothetical protein FJ399_09135 [Verrucomicrobia bacterium]|nr:hypothetical protein [Verrucomicrobiota bacterium]
MNNSRSSRSLSFLVRVGLPVALAASLRAANYHVSSSAGLDDNPGTEVAPWRSVAKVNATTFSPGDRILFKRGDAWSGTGLVVSNDGEAGRPVFFGAYGAGEKPALSGGPGEGIRIANRRHVEVMDLSFRQSGGQGVSCVNSNFISLRRVDVSNNGRGPGIVATQGGHILVEGCTVTNANNNGILFKGSFENRIHDSTIQQCVVRNTKGNDGIVLHNAATYRETVGDNIVIRGNRSEGNREQGYDITSGSHVLLEDNESSGNRGGGITIGHAARHVTLRRHYSHDELNTNVKISVPHVTIENSRFVGGAGTAPIVLIQPTLNTQVTPTVADGQPEDVVLRDNEFVWTSRKDGNALFITRSNRTPQGTFIDPAIRRLTMERNRWAGRDLAAFTLHYSAYGPPPDCATFTIRGNRYARSASWNVAGTTYSDFAAYQAKFDPSGSWQESTGGDNVSRRGDWMRAGRYGVFLHYQYRILLGYSARTVPKRPPSGRMIASEWNRLVDGFDVRGFADQMAEGGAGWVIFCLDDHFFAWPCSPNATFDRFTGYAPGEKCSRRDLIGEVADALGQRRVKLIVYFAGLNGYQEEPKVAAGLDDDGSSGTPPSAESRRRRLAILREYAERYGNRIAGWWFDDVRPETYRESPGNWNDIAATVRRPNPEAVIAFSYGRNEQARLAPGVDDYTGGDTWTKMDLEKLTPALVPAVDDLLWHGKIYCGDVYHGQGATNQFSDAELSEWIRTCNAQGGVCTLDWPIDPATGKLKAFGFEQLKRIRQILKGP